MYIYMSTPTPSYLEGEFGRQDVVANCRIRGWPNRRSPYFRPNFLEANQTKLLSN